MSNTKKTLQIVPQGDLTFSVNQPANDGTIQEFGFIFRPEYGVTLSFDTASLGYDFYDDDGDAVCKLYTNDLGSSDHPLIELRFDSDPVKEYYDMSAEILDTKLVDSIDLKQDHVASYRLTVKLSDC